MKSTLESRQKFRERIEDALSTIKDSEELDEAKGIIDDLDELVELQVLTAECLFRNKERGGGQLGTDYDDDDRDSWYDMYGWNNHLQSNDDVSLKKLYDYTVYRMGLFLGIGVHGGQWQSAPGTPSSHWMANVFESLKKAAETAKMSFIKNKPKIPQQQSTSIPLQPVTPMKPIGKAAISKTPLPSQYMKELENILNIVTGNNLSAVKVTHKTSGDFFLEGKNNLYLSHQYIPRTVVIKDDKGKKLQVFKETEIDRIAKFIAPHLV